MTLANYAMKLEREVWGALDGPWGSDTWMAWRRDWAQKVGLIDHYVVSASQVAHRSAISLLELRVMTVRKFARE